MCNLFEKGAFWTNRPKIGTSGDNRKGRAKPLRHLLVVWLFLLLTKLLTKLLPKLPTSRSRSLHTVFAKFWVLWVAYEAYHASTCEAFALKTSRVAEVLSPELERLSIYKKININII